MADEQTQAADAPAAEATETVSLLDEITAQTKRKPEDADYSQVKRGVEVLLGELLTPKRAGERVDKALVDAMIAEIDERMSRQVDEILHHKDFQKLESAW